MSVFGLCTDKAKVNFWRQEALPLPLAYLEDESLVATLKQSLKLAEDIASEALRPSVWATAANRLSGNADMKPDADRVRAVVDSFNPDRLYWSRLELPFRELLVALAAAGADRAKELIAWYWETLHTAAVGAYDKTIGAINQGADLKAVNAGRSLLYSQLRQIRATYHIPKWEKEDAA